LRIKFLSPDFVLLAHVLDGLHFLNGENQKTGFI